MKQFVLGVLVLLFISSCSDKKTDDETKHPDDETFIESLQADSTRKPSRDEEVIDAILDQIPSPIEISVLLKESGNRYNNSLLNSPGNFSKYTTNYKMALNLGIYSTDLGYTNIYGKNQDGVKYISSIKSLANELNIGQFFDMETIGRLAANSKNLDSLLMLTTLNFNQINHYLQSQSRNNLSTLMLTGGWIEAMQITTWHLTLITYILPLST